MAIEDEFDALKEYEKAKRIMINAVGQLDVRMPGDYIKLACEEAMHRWGLYTEGAYGLQSDQSAGTC